MFFEAIVDDGRRHPMTKLAHRDDLEYGSDEKNMKLKRIDDKTQLRSITEGSAKIPALTLNTAYIMSRGMRFPTIWHFHMCRLR